MWSSTCFWLQEASQRGEQPRGTCPTSPWQPRLHAQQGFTIQHHRASGSLLPKAAVPPPPASWSCTSLTGTGGYPTSHKVQLAKISYSAFHFSLLGKGGFWPVQLPQLTYPQGRWIFKWLMAIKFNSIRIWLRQKWWVSLKPSWVNPLREWQSWLLTSKVPPR